MSAALLQLGIMRVTSLVTAAIALSAGMGRDLWWLWLVWWLLAEAFSFATERLCRYQRDYIDALTRENTDG